MTLNVFLLGVFRFHNIFSRVGHVYFCFMFINLFTRAEFSHLVIFFTQRIPDSIDVIYSLFSVFIFSNLIDSTYLCLGPPKTHVSLVKLFLQNRRGRGKRSEMVSVVSRYEMNEI